MAEAHLERRLAAILAADVVGYSRLVEQDEAGTLAALRHWRETILRPTVDRCRGRVVKEMGDGFLVEFASAVNAVRCAVDLQQRMAGANDAADEARAIVLRVGVNLGDVVVDGTDIHGDGVNVAARLESIADPGGICISAAVFEQVDRQLPAVWEDMGHQTLKNITRQVRVYRLSQRGWVSVASTATHRSAEPSIAVLPFTNMSGDPEHEFFSDGATEDIITELSRFRSLFVIARNSTFFYKGKSIRVQDIARDLNVDYVVEGSVRRSGGRVRVTAQLIEARTGHHLWAERYDRDLADIFALQDEMALRIVTGIAPRLLQEETMKARRRPPADMRAHDHYLRAKVLIDTPRGIEDVRHGREHCEAAVAIDPSHARAHAYLAFSYVVGEALEPTTDQAAYLATALVSAERALALDANDNVCHWAVGETAFHSGQLDRALVHMGRAVALNPNDADVLIISGYIHCAVGMAEFGFSQMAMATARNPSSPVWYNWLRGVCLCIHGQYEDAVGEFARYVPPNSAVMRWRAYALAKLGRVDEARAQVRDLLAAAPGLTTKTLVWSLNEQHLIREDLIATLREAGVPD